MQFNLYKSAEHVNQTKAIMLQKGTTWQLRGTNAKHKYSGTKQEYVSQVNNEKS